MALKGVNDFLCLPSDARILKYDIKCVKKNQKVPISALKLAKMWNIKKVSPPEKYCFFNVALNPISHGV